MGVTSFRIYSYRRRNKSNQVVKTIFLTLVFLAIILEGVLYGWIMYQGKQFSPEKSDTLIVLGSSLEGEEPGKTLKTRLDKAIDLFNQEYAGQIIVSGGKGKNEAISEALAMKNYLVAKGIPAEKILMENTSTSTKENISNSKKIMQERGFKSAVIVTNNYHIYRAMRTANLAGLKVTGAVAPFDSWWVHYYRLRESLAVLYYWVTV